MVSGLRTFICNRRNLYYGITILLFASIIAGIWGWEYLDEQELAAAPNQPTTAPTGKVHIIIKIPARTLEVYNDNNLYKVYKIAVGKSNTPTPIGEWKVVWKDYNWGSGFGTRWMGLNVPWGIYGIHGTNNPWSIGRYASHGCIRMRNKDVEELFEWIPVGTSVRIEGKKTKVLRTLKYQASGTDVVALQLKLKELGYLTTVADGIFGKTTDAALRAYQLDKGIEPDGIANRRVLDLLGI
ncbi:Hypothetical protein LUCI_2059 [Lucifera butyrica]|uniref:L,D-TPase catalytic domain-containing protein n=1 Tax=Lucifera butyrica TaxID=1351585 RepID=A0A498R977_9FIRM|nr:L,D-transpeptidase family protein [Lucifera butyrica]VBB06822.1 Hypothetical protein LUCI_2059 [Lucifera butyrica]